ncbi:MAG TPA: 50S ribosomal protein L25 [Acidimicrobiia bacterium]|nr:50S ribosomal protein L25 [Acidimicrobiia bacterium]
MAEVNLKADTGRATGSRAARRLRKTGRIPAVVYGRGAEPTHVAVDHHDLTQAFHTPAGANVVINLQIDGAEGIPTLVRGVDRHPYKPFIRHVDFVRVDLTVRVHAEVAIHFVGSPIGVKEGGILVPARNDVTVEALPNEIPSAFELDVSELGINDSLHVSDLPQVEGVAILASPDELLVSVSIPAAEPEPEPEPVEGEEGEGAGAEGEEAPEAASEEDGEPGEE